MVIYDSLQQAEAYILAENGVMLQSRNTFIARDNVRVFNTLGDTLKTEELTWLQTALAYFRIPT